MFTTRSPILNLVLNFLIAWGLFALFANSGWIGITSSLPLWEIVLFTGLLSLVIVFLVYLLSIFALPLILVIAACTMGIGLILWPALVWYFSLAIIGSITGFFTVTAVWWQALLIGLAFSLLRFSTPSSD